MTAVPLPMATDINVLYARPTRVIDGDSFAAVINGVDDYKPVDVRIARYNAPEKRGPTKAAGLVALAWAEGWMAGPLTATESWPLVVRVLGRDDWRRWVCEVWRRSDGRNYSDDLYAAGQAVPYVPKLAGPVTEDEAMDDRAETTVSPAGPPPPPARPMTETTRGIGGPPVMPSASRGRRPLPGLGPTSGAGEGNVRAILAISAAAFLHTLLILLIVLDRTAYRDATLGLLSALTAADVGMIGWYFAKRASEGA